MSAGISERGIDLHGGVLDNTPPSRSKSPSPKWKWRNFARRYHR